MNKTLAKALRRKERENPSSQASIRGSDKIFTLAEALRRQSYGILTFSAVSASLRDNSFLVFPLRLSAFARNSWLFGCGFASLGSVANLALFFCGPSDKSV